MLLIISSHNPQIMRRNETLLDAANDILCNCRNDFEWKLLPNSDIVISGRNIRSIELKFLQRLFVSSVTNSHAKKQNTFCDSTMATSYFSTKILISR